MSKSSLIFFTVVFFSCKTTVNEVNNNYKIKPVEVKLENDTSYQADFKSHLSNIEVISLESSEQCFISRIEKVYYTNGFIYVLDEATNNLFLFSSTGKFIRKIGERGTGPGEYIDIADFEINPSNGNVLILAIEKQSLLEFDRKGVFLGAIKLPFLSYRFSFLNSSRLLFFNGYFDDDLHNLKITDLSGNLISQSFKFPTNQGLMKFAFTGNLTKNTNGGLYSDATSSVIYQINDDETIYPKYTIKFKDNAWPEKDRYHHEEFFESIQRGEVNFLRNNYEESLTTLFFSFNKKVSSTNKTVNNVNKVFFLKGTNKIFGPNSFKDDFLYDILTEAKGRTQDDRFISIIEPELYLSQYPNVIREETISSELKLILSNLKAESNPILFIYDFK